MKYRICKIAGCERKYYALGLCCMHYMRTRKGITDMSPGKLTSPGRPKGIKTKCIIKKCERPYYAKDFCRSHYNKNRRWGNPLYKKSNAPTKCSMVECRKIARRKGFCIFHYGRDLRSVPLEREWGIAGNLNCNWNGGVSEYKNHYEMKKNRLIVLERDKHKCHYCGKAADRIHHIDLSKDNHSLENLVASCPKCNANYRKPNNTNYRQEYGMFAGEIMKRLSMSRNHVAHLHQNGQLGALLPKSEFVPNYQI